MRQAKAEPDQNVDDERGKEGATDRSGVRDGDGAWPADRGDPLHGAAGGEEGMRLVKRVRHDVQQRQREERQPTFQNHEAHLRYGRPGE